jgi:hypothetical protein
MTRAEIQRLIKVLQNAYVCCHQCGDKYGVYSVGCSSMWEGKCDICGQTKIITETRDWAYFITGLRKLNLQLANIPKNKQKKIFSE